MCLAVYVASSIELPSIKWEKTAPAFYLKPARSRDTVRRQFSLPNVYYAGSHEGCGCGFLKDGVPDEESEIYRANYRALADCIRTAKHRGAAIELFSCWEGQQSARPEFVESVNVDNVEGPSFCFKEGHFVRVA